MKRQPHHQDQRGCGLNPQSGLIGLGAFGALVIGKLLQHPANGFWQPPAVTKPAQLLQGPAGEQARRQYRQTDRRHAQEEGRKVPAHHFRDQQVLGLAHHGRHATQGSTDGTMHQQATQERPEIFQVFPVQFDHFFVAVGIVVGVLIALAGSHPVINSIETHGNRDNNGRYRQGIQKSRQQRGRTAKQHRQRRLGPHTHQDLGEGDQQQLLHEIDPRHHEHQQQDHREIGEHLQIHCIRGSQPDQQGLHSQQSAGQKRVALQGHGQGEDKLGNQKPAGHSGPEDIHHDRVGNQKQQDHLLVPDRCLAKEVVGKAGDNSRRHCGNLLRKWAVGIVWQSTVIFLDIYVPGYGPKVHCLTVFGLNNNKKARKI